MSDAATKTILRSVERLSRSEVPLANMNTMVYGEPGSGKRDWLSRLRERLKALDTGSRVVVLSGGSELLTDAYALEDAIQRQIMSKVRYRLRKLWVKMIGTHRFGPFWVRFHRAGSEFRSEVARLNVLADSINKRARQPAIVLMIEDASTELRKARNAPGSFVLPFQKGTGGDIDNLKVLPIYVGNDEKGIAAGLFEFGADRLGVDRYFQVIDGEARAA